MVFGIVKVYRLKDSLTISLPGDVVRALSISEGDELDLIQYKGSYYILAKKSDIEKLITGSAPAQQPAPNVEAEQPAPVLSAAEIGVLKKLDTLRYSTRTPVEVGKVLKGEDRQVFKQLVRKKVVRPFKDEGQKTHYSIQKSVYDKYLMRKRIAKVQEVQAVTIKGAAPSQKYALNAELQRNSLAAAVSGASIHIVEAYIDSLQKDGFVVIQTEPEAAAVSTALEDSIRRGLVVGTRAFNKRFYIAMRSFINGNMPAIMAQISGKNVPVQELAKACKMSDDAVRTVLYILSESGEVTEVRKDIFRAA